MDKQRHEHPVSESLPDEFVRLPGLFRRWEIEQVVDPHADLRVEAAGDAADGTSLFAVYRRERSSSFVPTEE